jgi:hypothetical protein
MTDIGKIAISPDGKNLYVPSRGRSALAVFNRNATTGALTQKTGALGCYTSDSTIASNDNCTLVGTGLTGVAAVAVSANGSNVYTGGSDGGLVHFTRTSAGDLVYVGTGLNLGGQINSVTTSPDNGSVYTSHTIAPGGFIGVYQTSASGSGLVYRECLDSPTANWGCIHMPSDGYVDDPGDLLVTPDNKQLILANGETVSPSYSSGSIVGFTRTTSGTSRGDLAAPSTATCISGSMANCQTQSGVFYVRGLASGVTGTRIYAAGYYGVFRFDRNASTNALAPVTGTSACLSWEGNSFACGTFAPGVASSRVIPHRDIVIPPDGENIYSGTEGGTSTTLWSMSRGSSGSFASLPAPLRCLSINGGSPCPTVINGGTAIQSMAASAAGRNVYVAGNNRLFSFRRDQPPVCQNVGASTLNTTSVTVTLNCSDPDGDPLTFEKVTDPTHGTLAGVSGNHVSYGPQPGTTGADSFLYRARGAGVASDPASATVNVSAPPTGGGGGGTPPPLTVLSSSVSNHFLAFRKYTKVDKLTINDLPAGTRVRVQCKTKKKKQQKKGCPYKSRTVATTFARTKLSVLKPFKKKKMPPGLKITITITAPGFIGKQFTYTMRKHKSPKPPLRLCIPPGGAPARCA